VSGSQSSCVWLENGRYRGLVICEKLLEMLSVVKAGQDRGFCRGLAPSKADHKLSVIKLSVIKGDKALCDEGGAR